MPHTSPSTSNALMKDLIHDNLGLCLQRAMGPSVTKNSKPQQKEGSGRHLNTFQGWRMPQQEQPNSQEAISTSFVDHMKWSLYSGYFQSYARLLLQGNLARGNALAFALHELSCFALRLLS